MALPISKTLLKLKKYETNPEMFAELTSTELASLVVHVMSAVKQIESAMNTGQLDIGKQLKAEIDRSVKDGQSSFKAVVDNLDKITTNHKATTGQLNQQVEDAISLLKTKVSELKNGKDAEITDEHIRQAAIIASELVELPDFDFLASTAITSNGEAIRDALELLNGDDRLEQDAINGLGDTIRNIYTEIAKSKQSGQGGTIGKQLVYNFIRQAVTDGTIPAGGGSVSDEAYDATTWDGVTDEAPSKNAVRDKIESLAGGHDPVTVTDSAEIDFTLTGQDITASLIAGSIDETKLDASVNASLDLADSAAQPSDLHDPVTLAGTPNYLTIVGQTITRALIDLTSHVTGRLPFANLATLSAHSVLGRAGSGTGNAAGITMGNDTLLGRSGSGNVDDLSATQVRTLLNVEDGAAADQTAAQVPFTPAGNIAATDVQAALEELDTEKVAVSTTSDLGNLGTTEVIDFDNGEYQYGVANSDVTFTHTNEGEGRTVTLIIRYDGSAQRTATWSDVDEWVSGSEPTLPTGAELDTVVTLLRAGSTTYGFHNTSTGGGGGGVTDHGALTGKSDDDHTQYAIISSGAGSPSSTPARIGAIYVDTTNLRLFIGTGATDSDDWRYIETVANPN